MRSWIIDSTGIHPWPNVRRITREIYAVAEGTVVNESVAVVPVAFTVKLAGYQQLGPIK